MTDYERLRALIAAATPGPWTIGESSFFKSPDWAPINSVGWTSLAEVVVGLEGDSHDEGQANAALIVEAINALPALLDTLSKLEAERDEATFYLRNLLVSYVVKYCDPIPEWKPLDDLLGMLTQIDNASTVTGDILAGALTAEARLSEAEEVIGAVLDHCGARGTYHALKYTEAVEAAEAFFKETTNANG